MNPTIDFRHIDAAKPGPEFQAADPMDVQKAREWLTRKRIERAAGEYRKAAESSQRTEVREV